MLVNHLILGTTDVDATEAFYCLVFAYSRHSKFLDTGTGLEGIVLSLTGAPHLLIVPFAEVRLPNPQHMAFEVDRERFVELFHRAINLGLRTRAEPSLTSTKEGIGRLVTGDLTFDNFYLLDPSRINIEIMTRVP